ncbi:hypothetical protein EHS13_17240 [Paenibacillus psychroresistens]|uniref:Class I SAM-dependent methyltransferase n=1 Tax=Paenibacillus psychroresistens TaxID=1778678 RepID=A0A6B8RLU9_9BACL|nr:hypothetical protein [Paenibacillus psychroresistens]QGQ96505.1 hypothetical protein EHS13_17240 [Paenibacillus psychroresistens]
MLVKDIEVALSLAGRRGWNPDNDSISRSAFIHLLRRLEKSNDEIRIVQLGGGQAIWVWNSLHELNLLPIKTTIIEHHPARASQLIQNAEAMTGIDVHWSCLKQLTDEEREDLFNNPAEANEKCGRLGKYVKTDQYDHYQIRNAFYGELSQFTFLNESIDVLIVDGPHGNGRSLVFTWLYLKLKENALILIDDFNHYPFVADLERLFSYEELHRDTWGDQVWLLLRLKGKLAIKESV